MSQFVRFFAVTVLGVILDLAIAFALHQWAGVPLWLAAATGFAIAAGANYVIHQTWSFRSGPLSLKRAGLYAGVALVTLAAILVILVWRGLPLLEPALRGPADEPRTRHRSTITAPSGTPSYLPPELVQECAAFLRIVLQLNEQRIHGCITRISLSLLLPYMCA